MLDQIMEKQSVAAGNQPAQAIDSRSLLTTCVRDRIALGNSTEAMAVLGFR